MNLLSIYSDAESAAFTSSDQSWKPADSWESDPNSPNMLEIETLVEPEPSDEELLIIRCPLEKPCQTVVPENDWFELALKTVAPVIPVRNSWGDDEEEGEEELPDEESTDEEDDPDPFEDFDEDDFDDDFDDDFEEELDDEYEIEPKDDGFVLDNGNEDDDDPDLIDDDAIGPIAE